MSSNTEAINSIVGINKAMTHSPDAVTVTKVGSAVRCLGLSPGDKVQLAARAFAPQEGMVVVCEVLQDEGCMDEFEHQTGRWGSVVSGDILPCVLGNRYALKEFVGRVPKELHPGKEMHMLAESGLVGTLEAENTCYAKTAGNSLPMRFLGCMMGPSGGPVNTIFCSGCLIKHVRAVPRSVPIIGVCATAMECGKTTVICKLVKALSRATGLRVACGKVTGVACQRDCMRIADSGAFMSLDITDAGLPSTCGPAPTTVAAALGCIAALNEAQPDCILLEFGDGLLGRYNVDALLHRQEIMKHMVLLGIVSGDLVGTKGGIDLLRNEFHYQGPLFVTGPVVSSSAAVEKVSSMDSNVSAECNLGSMPNTTQLILSILREATKHERGAAAAANAARCDFPRL